MANNKYTLLLSFLLLIGCGTGEDKSAHNNGLGYGFDEETATGLRVRYHDASNPSAAFLDDVFSQVEACIGVTGTQRPLVIFMASVDRIATGGTDPDAATILATGTIVIEDLTAADPTSATYVFAHESIHWITHYHGLLTNSQQYAHDSPLFLDCATPTSIHVPQ